MLAPKVSLPSNVIQDIFSKLENIMPFYDCHIRSTQATILADSTHTLTYVERPLRIRDIERTNVIVSCMLMFLYSVSEKVTLLLLHSKLVKNKFSFVALECC